HTFDGTLWMCRELVCPQGLTLRDDSGCKTRRQTKVYGTRSEWSMGASGTVERDNSSDRAGNGLGGRRLRIRPLPRWELPPKRSFCPAGWQDYAPYCVLH